MRIKSPCSYSSLISSGGNDTTLDRNSYFCLEQLIINE